MFASNQIYSIIDYETFSEANLKEVGSFEYSKHPSTEILCVSWMTGTREELEKQLRLYKKYKDSIHEYKYKAESWFPKQSWNKDIHVKGQFKLFMEIMTNKKIIKVAHNAMFEKAITMNVLPRYMKGYK